MLYELFVFIFIYTYMTGVCGNNMSTTNVFIQSPGYPKLPPPGVKCEWIIYRTDQKRPAVEVTSIKHTFTVCRHSGLKVRFQSMSCVQIIMEVQKGLTKSLKIFGIGPGRKFSLSNYVFRIFLSHFRSLLFSFVYYYFFTFILTLVWVIQ